jgi:hypothetical protein
MSTTNPSPGSVKETSTKTVSEKDGAPIDWKKGMEALEQARDEIALKLHLASMEARTEWEKLDTSIRETNHFHSTESRSDEEKHSVVSDLIDKVRDFGAKLAAKT